jgi:hypothetical protein
MRGIGSHVSGSDAYPLTAGCLDPEFVLVLHWHRMLIASLDASRVHNPSDGREPAFGFRLCAVRQLVMVSLNFSLTLYRYL